MAPETSPLYWALTSGGLLSPGRVGQPYFVEALEETVYMAREDGYACRYVECGYTQYYVLKEQTAIDLG